MDDRKLMGEFDADEDMDLDEEESLDFDDDNSLTEDEEAENLNPSVLGKGSSRPRPESDEDWRRLLMKEKAGNAPEYGLLNSYREGDLVLHPRYGLGVVSKVISPCKMEVIYEVQKRLMAMNAPPPE